MHPIPGLRRRAWLGAAALLLALAAPCRAAPRDELLRLVPEDVAFCLVVQDVREQATALLASPFARVFPDTPLAAALKASEEVKKLREVESLLKKHLELDGAGLRDQLLGDAVVLAYRANPPGKTDQDQGLLLLRARDERVLADFVERLNRVQKESGDLKELETRRHAGASYQRRVERKGENFYYLDGPVLAFTSQELLLREAIERARRPTEGEPPIARRLRLLGANRSLAALWINPRTFDAEMERNAAAARGQEADAQRAFLRLWKALDDLALSLSLGADVRLTLAVQARTDDLPPHARRLFAGAARPSNLWPSFPDGALFAAAGHTDPAALLGFVGEFLSPEARTALHDTLERNLGAPSGKLFLTEVLPAIGPDWGVCVTAPATAEKGWFPHTLLALRVRPAPEGADRALLSAVNLYTQMAVIAHNRSGKAPISLKTVAQDKVEVKYLAGEEALPPGLQPAFALRDGYLLLASSPEVIRRFVAPAAEPQPGDEVPLARLSVRELCRFVKERREPLAGVIAEKHGLTKEEAGRRLDRFVAAVQIIDRVELGLRSEKGKASLTLRVQAVQPLK